MKPENKQEYIRYRLESSRKTFEAAKVLAENGYWNSAINRLYYSVFYSVNALLYNSDISVKKHSSVKSQFTLHYIKSSKLDKKFGQLLSDLFDLRQKGDYDNIYDYDEESVMPLIPVVEEMLEVLEKTIEGEFNI